ncbi:lipopolysaccharide biosynthesis protein [Ulvibacter antarcticus]|nr:polysaccharide biosynthesis C-terminal domain-containing protein [Ulvibacter antarcticus]
MASKFIIFTILSKYFDTETYGVYSLQATTITIAIFILGFDFYNYTIRDILINKENTSSKIFTSLSLYVTSYLLFTIIGYFLFTSIDYFADFTFLLIIICITEHLNQEIYRLLLAFKKVLVANILLFVRVAGWTLFVLYQIYAVGIEVTIRDVLLIWMWFNIMTLLLTFVLFWKIISSALSSIRFKKDWLLKGIRISMIFYVATIFLKIIEYSNRYIVEGVLGEAAAGIFSFYSNFAMVIGIYVSTIVVSYELPDLIESSTGDNFNSKLKNFKKLLIVHSLVASFAVLIFMYPILIWQGKPEFISYWPLIVLFTVGMCLMNISLVYHSYLYIKHKEKKLLEIVVISGIINVVITYGLCKFYGLYGAAGAFLITAVLMYLLRRNAAKNKAFSV